MTRTRHGSGHFAFSGAVSMLITRADGYITGPQAAQLAGVDPATIRKWRQRGHLEPRGLDERGFPLYHPDDVARADKRVRDNGLRTSGIDPRSQRKAAA
jgi:MerR HTH family regulatory protein